MPRSSKINAKVSMTDRVQWLMVTALVQSQLDVSLVGVTIRRDDEVFEIGKNPLFFVTDSSDLCKTVRC